MVTDIHLAMKDRLLQFTDYSRGPGRAIVRSVCVSVRVYVFV